MPWHVGDIADALAGGLRTEAARRDDERAVRGIDACDEVALHPFLAQGLAAAGFGAHREQRYPSDRSKRKQSEGERCDLVATPDGRPLRAPDAAPTLFDPEDAVPLDDAYWIEVKSVAQFVEGRGNRQYTAQLGGTVRKDITKLSKDPDILHAALAIVIFAADEQIARHDVQAWYERSVQQGRPLAAPAIRTFAMNDRCGNGCCAVALYPVWHL